MTSSTWLWHFKMRVPDNASEDKGGGDGARCWWERIKQSFIRKGTISSSEIIIIVYLKSRIWDTPNLLTDDDSSTNIFVSAGVKKELIAFVF